jgi:hypothetical protein
MTILHMNDIDQAKHTMLTRVSLLDRFFQMKKGTTGYRIKNYDEQVLAILDDEHKKQYENTDDINDKYWILLNCLLNNIPPILSAIDKRECKQVLTYKMNQFEKYLKMSRDWEIAEYEKDIEPEYVMHTK